jgi:hypothetical protein
VGLSSIEVSQRLEGSLAVRAVRTDVAHLLRPACLLCVVWTAKKFEVVQDGELGTELLFSVLGSRTSSEW